VRKYLRLGKAEQPQYHRPAVPTKLAPYVEQLEHIRAQADSGAPTVAAEPDGEVAALYKALARKVAAKIAGQGKDYSSKFPTIAISKNT
jgi:hypothetical protein